MKDEENMAGANVDGDVNTGGGDFVGRDKNVSAGIDSVVVVKLEHLSIFTHRNMVM